MMTLTGCVSLNNLAHRQTIFDTNLQYAKNWRQFGSS